MHVDTRGVHHEAAVGAALGHATHFISAPQPTFSLQLALPFRNLRLPGEYDPFEDRADLGPQDRSRLLLPVSGRGLNRCRRSGVYDRRPRRGLLSRELLLMKRPPQRGPYIF
jgi:hypothetical protein